MVTFLHLAKLGDLSDEFVWESEAKGLEKNQDDAAVVVEGAVVIKASSLIRLPNVLSVIAKDFAMMGVTSLGVTSFWFSCSSFSVTDGPLSTENWKNNSTLKIQPISACSNMFSFQTGNTE